MYRQKCGNNEPIAGLFGLHVFLCTVQFQFTGNLLDNVLHDWLFPGQQSGYVCDPASLHGEIHSSQDWDYLT